MLRLTLSKIEAHRFAGCSDRLWLSLDAPQAGEIGRQDLREELPTKASFRFGKCHDFFSKGFTLGNGYPDFETQPYVAYSSSLLFVDSNLNRCASDSNAYDKGLDPRGFFVCSICGEQGR